MKPAVESYIAGLALSANAGTSEGAIKGWEHRGTAKYHAEEALRHAEYAKRKYMFPGSKTSARQEAHMASIHAEHASEAAETNEPLPGNLEHAARAHEAAAAAYHSSTGKGGIGHDADQAMANFDEKQAKEKKQWASNIRGNTK